VDIQEHSVVLVSVIVGLGLTELLSRFSRLIRSRGRVRWYGLSLAWVVFALLVVVSFWWGVYLGSLGITEPGSSFEFLLNLSTPVIVYLLCATALPEIDCEQDVDLRAEYFSGARYFFSLAAAYVVFTAAQVAVQAGGLEWSRLMAIRVGLLAGLLPLIWVRSERYHWCAALVVLTLIAYRMTFQVLH
jgi:hypothetical protein